MVRDGFPITTWPGVPVPDPPVQRHRVSLDPQGWLTVEMVDGAEWEPLPPEFVLRQLLDLDLEQASPVDLAEFLNTWGSINKAFGLPVEVDGHELQPPPGSECHAEDVRNWLAVAQALTRTWLAWNLDDYLLPAWDGTPEHVVNEAAAWLTFAHWMNVGLKAFPMHVGLSHGHGAGSSGAPAVGLFSACCVQLCSIVSEALPPHECQNENCRRPFIRQLGTAKQGQHRTTGVLYCSQRCQRAQAARNHRQRIKEGKR